MEKSTKVISVRIPFEMYEDIMQDAIMNNLSISEYIILHFTLVKKMHINQDNMINDIANCENYDCPLAEKFRYLLNKCNSEIDY